MKIYVSHSSGFDFRKELYIPIRNSELNNLHEFVFPHEKDAVLFNTKELFLSKTCDIVIVECSYPSTGQGIELGWADLLNIPIICIHRSDARISASLSAVCMKLLSYSDIEDMQKVLKNILSNYA